MKLVAKAKPFKLSTLFQMRFFRGAFNEEVWFLPFCLAGVGFMAYRRSRKCTMALAIGAHLTSTQRALTWRYLTNVRCGPWEAMPKSRRLFREIGLALQGADTIVDG
jgi:hypothetical protein